MSRAHFFFCLIFFRVQKRLLFLRLNTLNTLKNYRKSKSMECYQTRMWFGEKVVCWWIFLYHFSSGWRFFAPLPRTRFEGLCWSELNVWCCLRFFLPRTESVVRGSHRNIAFSNGILIILRAQFTLECYRLVVLIGNCRSEREALYHWVVERIFSGEVASLGCWWVVVGDTVCLDRGHFRGKGGREERQVCSVLVNICGKEGGWGIGLVDCGVGSGAIFGVIIGGSDGAVASIIIGGLLWRYTSVIYRAENVYPEWSSPLAWSVPCDGLAAVSRVGCRVSPHVVFGCLFRLVWIAFWPHDAMALRVPFRLISLMGHIPRTQHSTDRSSWVRSRVAAFGVRLLLTDFSVS